VRDRSAEAAQVRQDGPGGNFDTGLVVGDYYLIEALTRYERVAAGRSVLVPR
jgi:hypothetical protein